MRISCNSFTWQEFLEILNYFPPILPTHNCLKFSTFFFSDGFIQSNNNILSLASRGYVTEYGRIVIYRIVL